MVQDQAIKRYRLENEPLEQIITDALCKLNRVFIESVYCFTVIDCVWNTKQILHWVGVPFYDIQCVIKIDRQYFN